MSETTKAATSRDEADALAAFDLAFVVDTTASMGTFLAAAQRQMIEMIDALAQEAEVALRLAVVEYRDHPPQDSVLCRVHRFTPLLTEARTTITRLDAQGGGDGPEAVFDGLRAASDKLAWRPHARRVAVLVGDAPPHGAGGYGDGFPQGCPCGATCETVTAALEERRVTLFALGLTAEVRESFGRLCAATGGEFFPSGAGDEAIVRLRSLLREEFGALAFDRSVLERWGDGAGVTLDALVDQLGSSRPAVSRSLSRLGARDLLKRGGVLTP